MSGYIPHNILPCFDIISGEPVIEVKESSRNNAAIADALEANVSVKDYVEVDKDARKGKYVRFPERKELSQEVNELLVVEYYNR